MRAMVSGHVRHTRDLKLGEIATPTIGDDEVLVRVHAAGVDRVPKNPVRGMTWRDASRRSAERDAVPPW
jgi:NADPH:quinone reductase-like Zn-dependent oxidoreductase